MTEPSIERNTLIIELHDAGLSYARIAAQVGITPARARVIYLRFRQTGRLGGMVSNCKSCGEHRRHPKPMETHFWPRVVKGPDCWLWDGGTKYGMFHGEDGIGRPAHRVAYESVNGPIPAGLLVRHKCDNPPCVRPDHLELGTSDQNYQDWATRGRFRLRPGGPIQTDTTEPTARQLVILLAYVECGGSQAAADRLGLAERTVRNTLAILRAVLGGTNTAQTFAIAIQRGLIDPNDLRIDEVA